MNSRYEELDAIRGIAALLVLMAHFQLIYNDFGERIDSIINPFFSFAQNAHSAVIAFFVLSGFVLSLIFSQNEKINYKNYLIQRICRIYLPYIFIIVIAIGAKILLHSKMGTISGLVSWGMWEKSITFNRILDHVLFLGEFDHTAFVMVIWSLVHEMRISIIFPLLMLLLMKFDWKIVIITSILLTGLSFFFMKITYPEGFYPTVNTSYIMTLHFIPMFVIGSLIAINRNYLLSKLNTKIKYFLLPLGIIFFSYPKIPYIVILLLIGDVDFNLYLLIIDWIIAVGAALIIFSALSLKGFSKLLRIKPFLFLGRISYSVYLVHPVVLIPMVYVLNDKISIPLILAISFIVTVIASWLCNKFIEKPSIKLGRYLTKDKQIQSRKASA